MKRFATLVAIARMLAEPGATVTLMAPDAARGRAILDDLAPELVVRVRVVVPGEVLDRVQVQTAPGAWHWIDEVAP